MSGNKMRATLPRAISWTAVWLATITLTVAIYWPGLSGDFLFDDTPHIVRNGLVQIDGLSVNELNRAWNSSTFSFPASRPLAMLTFGVNHTFSGLDPFAFKLTNLALHLLTGLVLFAASRRLAGQFLRMQGRDALANVVNFWAWLTAALWLLHPINLSPVLLSVQRMTILSALFVFLGIFVYLIGRQRMIDGRRGGIALIWTTPVFSMLGLISKENALLLPLLLLVIEWVLLRWHARNDRDRKALVWFFVVVVAIPGAIAAGYLLLRPDYLAYGGRPFTLEERLLTEARVLWSYLRLLLFPDIGAMGLATDDIVISRSLTSPWTTLPAVVGWAAGAIVGIFLRRKAPLLSFAILFFLAGHLLESSIFPLELAYEHRNYVPSFGVFLALAAIPTINAALIPVRQSLLLVLVSVGLLALAAMTAFRAHDWSSEERLIIAEVENHPNSPRANFRFAQLLMSLPVDELKAEAADVARLHLQRIIELDPNNTDGLFGLIILDLQQNRLPPPQLVESLAELLRRIPFSPLNITTDHFPYLVRIAQRKDQTAILPQEQMHLLFDAALDNPTIPSQGRAIIYNSLRAYYLIVLRDVEQALAYAKLAVEAVPNIWGARDRLIRLLAAAHKWDEAEDELQKATDMDRLGLHSQEAKELEDVIAAARRGEPVLVSPPGKDI